MYHPSEDSYFFAEFLKKQKLNKKSVLDMGTGSGILAETCLHLGAEVIASDINPESVKFVAKKGITVVQSDLFKPINDIEQKCSQSQHQIINKSGAAKRSQNKNEVQTLSLNGKFDIILFNAPYLPRDKNEPKDSQLETTGGKRGDEISIKFLKQAVKHLNKDGKIFLLISSLTPLNKIDRFHPKIVARKKLFFEELLILEFTSQK